MWLAILLTSPIVLWLLLLLLPTGDDWTYTTYPNYNPNFWIFLLPYRYYWRPFDGIFGYIVALNDGLFPALNHIFIYLGHTASAFMVWLIARQLKFDELSRIVTTIFYYISPAILGTLLTIDSLNQIYAALWGLIATWNYLRNNKHSLILWFIFTVLAVFSKENGIVWFFIPPLIAWAFKLRTRKEVFRHIAYGVAFFIVYWIIRNALPNYGAQDNNAYIHNTLFTKFRNLAKYIILSYTSIDFVSIFHKTSRNIPFLVVTALLSFPLFIYNIIAFLRKRRDIRTWTFLFCSFVAASPHIMTLFSTMHAYSGVAPLALLVGWIAPKGNAKENLYKVFFSMFVVSALLVDYRHWQKSYVSGITGYRMAEETVKQLRKPSYKVYCLSIDNGEKKYSSFCVIPFDAFGWGNAVILYNHDKWPKVLDTETKEASKVKNIGNIVKEKLSKGYNSVWIVNNDSVKVFQR